MVKIKYSNGKFISARKHDDLRSSSTIALTQADRTTNSNTTVNTNAYKNLKQYHNNSRISILPCDAPLYFSLEIFKASQVTIK